ncbi:MAG: hypothetical protein ABR548_02995 [Actinomycetota bacterium]|nr:hypothetical protein [Actinomycetota bacterium]
MIPSDIEAELGRIANLPPLERAEAAEALEAELRTALDQIAPDTRPA